MLQKHDKHEFAHRITLFYVKIFPFVHFSTQCSHFEFPHMVKMNEKNTHVLQINKDNIIFIS